MAERTSRLVADRWTLALAKGGWTPVANFFLDYYHKLNPPIRYAEAMLVIHLMRFKWDAAAPYPAFKTLANRMGISTQSARIYARNLQRSGYLQREMTKGATNRFHLRKLFQALEALAVKLAEEKKAQREAAVVTAPFFEAPAEAVARAKARPMETTKGKGIKQAKKKALKAR